MFEFIKKIIARSWSKIGDTVTLLFKALRFKSIEKALRHTFHLDQRLVLALSSRRMPSARQLKYLPRLLSKGERLMLLILILIFFVSSGFLGMRFYLAHRIFVPTFGGEYVEAIVGTPRNINPLYARTNATDADLVAMIYSGLLRHDGAGALVPELAESYEISNDLKTYVFKLRSGIRFHDGVLLGADDVVFTINSIKDPAWKSPLNVSFAGVTAEKIDDLQVRLKLKEPFAPFLQALTVGILPKHLWQAVTPASARLSELNSKPIGSGPFKFRSFVRSKDGSFKSYTVERNALFYRKKPYLDRLVFHFYPDYGSAAAALKNHIVSGISSFSIGGAAGDGDFKDKTGTGLLVGEVDKNPEVEYYKLKLPQYTALFFNIRKNDILAQSKVRQALALALDRERILLEATRNEGSLINAPILEGFLGFNPNIKPVPFDPAQSVEMLEGLGWKFTSTSTVRMKKQNLLQVRLLTLDRPEYLQAASIIIENWKSVGVDAVYKSVSASEMQREIIRSRDYDALLYGEVLGLDPDPYPFWHSSQIDDPGLNLSGFINREADKMLEEARVLSSPEDRAARHRAFQEILVAELPAIFLYTPNYIYPQRKIIRGFDIKLLSVPSDRFANVPDWYIKTKRAFK